MAHNPIESPFMKKSTAVVIGCGAIAREHLGALQGLEGVEVLAVCDLSAARAEATAERFGIASWHTDYEQMLEQVRPDLVHITTPPSSHFPIAKNCLSRQLNVLCEKPITVDYVQFKELRRLAEENGCIFLENQNLRYHSSILRIQDLLKSGKFGNIVDVQIFLSLNLVGPGSPYIDPNASHFGMSLRGGVIGDFLPHIAYLTYLFTGPVLDLRTIWMKQTSDTPLPSDEFRCFVKGERAPAYVGFSGVSNVNGYWIRVTGTQMYAETNLLEPPRLTLRRHRNGEPALASLVDGIAEARDTFRGTVAGFWRKLGGTSSYDGLPEMIRRTYYAVAAKQPQPIPLAEIDHVAQLVENFTRQASKL
jgi:predicted dehydrogenase